MNAPINATTTGLQCNQNRLYRFRPRSQPSVVLAKLLTQRVNEPSHLTMISRVGRLLNAPSREYGLSRTLCTDPRISIGDPRDAFVMRFDVSQIYCVASYAFFEPIAYSGVKVRAVISVSERLCTCYHVSVLEKVSSDDRDVRIFSLSLCQRSGYKSTQNIGFLINHHLSADNSKSPRVYL